MNLLRVVICLGILFGLAGCRNKSESTAQEVEEAGYEMTSAGWYGAIADNDVAVLRKMVKGGFEEKVLDAEGNGALHAAVAAGSKEVGEYLLNRGFSVDQAGAGRRTPLMVAVLEDRPEMVKWLLRQGADPTIKDVDGFSPLMLAVTQGKSESAEELAPFNREDLDSALLLGALVGEAEVIDVLTNYGASVYSRMEDGRTSLMLAAENGHREAVALLMDIGASRFATTDDGSTAQSLAVAAGHGEIAEMIATGFTGEVLALESDEEVVAAMDDYLAELDPFAGEDMPSDVIGIDPDGGDETGSALGGTLTGEAQGGEQDKAVKSLDGALVSNPNTAKKADLPDEIADGISGQTGTPRAQENDGVGDGVGDVRVGEVRVGEVRVETPVVVEARSKEPPLVMRVYRQRELPVEVKEVSGGLATLNLAGAEPQQVQVSAGDEIPGSSLVVVRVYNRMEEGKLNSGVPMEVGIVEVEDTGSGKKREWIAGRSASAHDPVALVEDAVSGERYVAKPGQKFRSESGREFVVSDVRPSQLVIEDTTTGEVRTLRLAGPKG